MPGFLRRPAFWIVIVVLGLLAGAGFYSKGQQAEKKKKLEAAAAQGWVDRDRIIGETLTSIRRAGADIILTNTFGGNRHRLKLHNAQGQVREINIAAAKNASAYASAKAAANHLAVAWHWKGPRRG